MHIRSFRISGVRAYCIGSPTTGGAGHGWSANILSWVSVICSYGVLACISGSAENHTNLQRWVQGCLSCGIKVGIRSFYIGRRSF
jgi:hypothetical protein